MKFEEPYIKVKVFGVDFCIFMNKMHSPKMDKDVQTVKQNHNFVVTEPVFLFKGTSVHLVVCQVLQLPELEARRLEEVDGALDHQLAFVRALT